MSVCQSVWKIVSLPLVCNSRPLSVPREILGQEVALLKQSVWRRASGLKRHMKPTAALHFQLSWSNTSPKQPHSSTLKKTRRPKSLWTQAQSVVEQSWSKNKMVRNKLSVSQAARLQVPRSGTVRSRRKLWVSYGCQVWTLPPVSFAHWVDFANWPCLPFFFRSSNFLLPFQALVLCAYSRASVVGSSVFHGGERDI